MSGPVVRCEKCLNLIPEEPNTPLESREPCPLCGSKARNYAISLGGSIRGLATVTAELTFVGAKESEPPPQTAAKGSILLEAGYELKWLELTEHGAWCVQVFRGDELIEMSSAIDPQDALLAVVEALLPPR